MGRIISIREYSLKSEINGERFEQVLHDAEARGLLQLPGLVAHHFVKGAKGVRRGAYAALWIYESREAWEHLWGTPDHPRPPQEYPATWKIWEDELLAPLLEDRQDATRFTAYEELEGFDGA
jgi:hypothetical protein